MVVVRDSLLIRQLIAADGKYGSDPLAWEIWRYRPIANQSQLCYRIFYSAPEIAAFASMAEPEQFWSRIEGQTEAGRRFMAQFRKH